MAPHARAARAKGREELSARVPRDAWIFVAATYAATFALDAHIVRSGASAYSAAALIGARMWIPGAVGAILSLRRGSSEPWALLRRLPAPRWIAAGYLLPVAAGALSLALLAATRTAAVGPRPDVVEKYGGLRPFLLVALAKAPTLGLLAPLAACLGEEIGWRGFLLPSLSALGPARRRLTVGLVWAAWHWPLILFGDYATSDRRLLSLVLFTATVTGSGVFVCWLQERSRSLWTSVVHHAAHNLWIIGIVPGFFVPDALTPYLAGESGVFVAAAYVLAGLAFLRAPVPRGIEV